MVGALLTQSEEAVLPAAGVCPASVPVLVGVSEAIRKVCALIDTVAASDCNVLIEGETGTGKELAARRVHAGSGRRDGSFIPVNCAGISETLFESQFFGHVRGAFTGAEQSSLGLVRSAEGGTLMMDEIGEVPLNLQAKLLRVLQDGEVLPVGSATPIPVRTRFVAATNRRIKHAVAEGTFRQDLYYRLNVVRIVLPPLRDRREDIPVLVNHFLATFAERYKCSAIDVDAETRDMLSEHAWPGNVRELISWVESLYATKIAPYVLACSLLEEVEEEDRTVRPEKQFDLQNLERSAIADAMKFCDNNRTEAARVLGIDRSTLVRKIDRHNLG